MKRMAGYFACFSLLIFTAIAFAEIKTLIKEYTYQASELDSKISCRAIVLEQVKRELLEELGSYIESTTVVVNSQIEKDEIKTISAGVVQTKILAENWDGKYFWIKAEVSADPNEVAAAIEKVRNDQKLSEELAESQAEKEAALKEVDRLKAELKQSNADKEKIAEYNQAVNRLQAADSFEQGTAMTVAGDYEGAASAYDRVIYLRPEDPKAYFGRSIVYIYLGNYTRATQDLDRAMVIRPANTNSYFQRASAYKSIRETQLNDPYRKPFPGKPLRPVVPVPLNDPLKKYLDNKQTQHKLVKVNPFQPRPAVQKNLNQEKKRAWQQRKKEQGEQKSLEKQQRQNLRKKERPVLRQPVTPAAPKRVNVPPPDQPRVERVQNQETKENKKNPKQRHKDQDDERPNRR